MEIGRVRQVAITDEMKAAYLDYAMSVITARALPDVRDGLKPVQRRILYTMDNLGLKHTSAYKKSARIVGECLGKFHPHGDVAVYEAMVRLAQDFSMRAMLVDGQGNFGSVDGDPPAAMRYTEARMSAIAEEMLADIEKDTADFADNFDGTLKEPSVLPSRVPNLLVNGATGIAVGMATNIPPHNLAEVADAIVYLIDHPKAALDDLMRFIPGPDFPTGGFLYGADAIRSAYASGKGRLIVRAKAHVEDMKGNRQCIVVTELPYQVNKANLAERIADLVKEGRIEDISNLRDESDRNGMRLVIELKRDAVPQVVLNQLFKYTTMQTTFGAHLLALVNGEPRLLSLKQALDLFIEFREEVITRRSKFDLEKARQRAHILEGLKIALDSLDEVIETIRHSRDADTARVNLIRKFKFTEVQAQAILDMQLRRLAALERRKVEEELAEVRQTIAYLVDLLKSKRRILDLIKQEQLDLKKRYGDARRTQIETAAAAEFTAEDLIPDENVLVTISEKGYVKRQALSDYRPARGGRKALLGVSTREDDAVQRLLVAHTHHSLLFFTNRGKVYQLAAHQVPDVSRAPAGQLLRNLVALEDGEVVTAVVAVPGFEPTRTPSVAESAVETERPSAGQAGGQAEYLTMATRDGKIKRCTLGEFSSVRPSGLVAMSLDEGDELGWVHLTHGNDEVIVVTALGQALRFSEETVRPMGRAAGGVGAIKLQADPGKPGQGDRVIGMEAVQPNADLLVVSRNGMGKRSPLADYPTQGRNGGGVRTTSVTGKTGPLVAARMVRPTDEVTLLSAKGVAVRVTVAELPLMSRATQGKPLLELEPGDQVTAIARIEGEAPKAAPPREQEPPAETPKPARARGKPAAKTEEAQPARRRRAAVAKEAEATRPAETPKPARARGKSAAKKKEEPAAPAEAKPGPSRRVAAPKEAAIAPPAEAPKPTPAPRKAVAKKEEPPAPAEAKPARSHRVAAPKGAATTPPAEAPKPARAPRKAVAKKEKPAAGAEAKPARARRAAAPKEAAKAPPAEMPKPARAPTKPAAGQEKPAAAEARPAPLPPPAVVSETEMPRPAAWPPAEPRVPEPEPITIETVPAYLRREAARRQAEAEGSEAAPGSEHPAPLETTPQRPEIIPARPRRTPSEEDDSDEPKQPKLL